MNYIYDINIIEESTGKSVYSSTAEGKNQKDAVGNFRKQDAKIRDKYIEKGGFYIGIKRIGKSPFQ